MHNRMLAKAYIFCILFTVFDLEICHLYYQASMAFFDSMILMIFL